MILSQKNKEKKALKTSHLLCDIQFMFCILVQSFKFLTFRLEWLLFLQQTQSVLSWLDILTFADVQLTTENEMKKYLFEMS